MTGDMWQRIEAVYQEAAQLPADARSAFLDRACGGDAVVRAEVESLLAYTASADRFIEQPAIQVAARAMAGEWEAASLSGQTIGAFRVLERIGEGGMGVVYEAEDTRLGRKVALKFLSPGIAGQPRALERFRQEARAASALTHPHICTIHSIQEYDGQPFIEMERLDGVPLRERIGSRFTVHEIITIALQLVDALEAAHRHGIIHRDLKPANIFCTPRGVKILDFGIATLAASTESGIAGTPGYMSPEQAAGEAVDARTDLFALGAVLHEMITGHPSDRASTATMPRALEDIIARLRQRDPRDRYQSATELRADLTAVQSRLTRRLPWSVATAVILTGAAIALLVLRPRGDDADADLKLRQLTHADWPVTSGAISPDGQYVVFADARGVHLLTAGTDRTRDIVSAADAPAGTSWDVTPGWLSSERFVINATSSAGPSQSSVWVAELTAAPIRIHDRARASSVSPDGFSIAFATERGQAGDRDLWIMRADGSDERRILTADAGTAILSVLWSPDSQRLAYLRRDQADAPYVETRALSGGPAETILRPEDPDILQGAMWLRDGRLIFSLNRATQGTSGGTMLCSHWQLRVDNDGHVLERATRLAGWLPQCVAGLSFTADSAQAVYLQAAFNDAIHVGDLDHSGDSLIASRPLTPFAGRNIPSGWTIDSREVVYVSDRDGSASLYRQPLDSDNARRVADDPGIIGAARVAPDGASVLYLVAARRASAPARLMRAPIDGGDSAQVMSGAFVDGGARCALRPASRCAIAERSSDGRTLTFSAIDPVKGRGEALLHISITPNTDYRWALSGDGTRVALLDAKSNTIELFTLTTQDHNSVTVTDLRRLGYVSWAAHGDALIAPGVDAHGQVALMRIALDGSIRTLWRADGVVDTSAIPSPDGRHLAIWARTQSSQLWLADSP